VTSEWSVFSPPLSKVERNLVFELRETGNRWAHHEQFTWNDVDRSFDSVERLLHEVAPKVSATVRQTKLALRDRLNARPSGPEKWDAGSDLDVRPSHSSRDTGPVEAAVRHNIAAGTVLLTPTGRGQFTVAEIGDRGPYLDLGRQKARTLIPWKALEGIPEFLGASWRTIGSRYEKAVDPGTLDGYMKRFVNRTTAGWVACLLEAAGVVRIDRTQRAARLSMRADFPRR
jgi:hypothetical protein